MADQARECRIVLIGMMGSGKSTIGRLLAEHTGWPYHDNDVLLLRSRGETARQLLASAGEDEMRRAEAEALLLGLTRPAPCLLGAAAGAILDEQGRAALESGIVVWLSASPATLAERAAGAAHRPWLETEAEAWMARTLGGRGPLYESVADLAVDTDGRTPTDVAAGILAWLSGLDVCRPWLAEV